MKNKWYYVVLFYLLLKLFVSFIVVASFTFDSLLLVRFLVWFLGVARKNRISRSPAHYYVGRIKQTRRAPPLYRPRRDRPTMWMFAGLKLAEILNKPFQSTTTTLKRSNPRETAVLWACVRACVRCVFKEKQKFQSSFSILLSIIYYFHCSINCYYDAVAIIADTM